MRTRLALAAGTAALALVGSVFAASPALAACNATAGDICSANTLVTVNLTGGSLSISAPGTATLAGSAAPGTIIAGNMGTAASSVTDNTGSLAGWQVTAVTDGNLVSGSDSIALTAAGPLTLTPSVLTGGTNTLAADLLPGVGSTPANVAPGAGGGLNATTPVAVAAALPLSGSGTFSYTPSLSLVVPPNTVAHNNYTVTITQTLL